MKIIGNGSGIGVGLISVLLVMSMCRPVDQLERAGLGPIALSLEKLSAAKAHHRPPGSDSSLTGSVGMASGPQTAKAVPSAESADIAASLDLETLRLRYESVEVVATGYYAGKESTGKEPGHPQYGITYSGVEVRRDPDSISTIAADLNVFPLGTVLYIPDYGYGIVTDTGAAIRGNKIDLYFHTKEDVYKEWGKKTLDVYIIRKGNGKVTEEMMLDLSRTFKS